MYSSQYYLFPVKYKHFEIVQYLSIMSHFTAVIVCPIMVCPVTKTFETPPDQRASLLHQPELDDDAVAVSRPDSSAATATGDDSSRAFILLSLLKLFYIHSL